MLSTLSLLIFLNLISILLSSILLMLPFLSEWYCSLLPSYLEDCGNQKRYLRKINHRGKLRLPLPLQQAVKPSSLRKNMMHKINPQSSQEKRTLSIQADEAGIRLDRYLTSVLTGISRTTVQQLIVDGAVLINGHAGKSGYMLRSGDEVQVFSLNIHNKAINIQPQSLPLEVVYEDKDLLVVNQAAGMVVHPAPAHHDDTLVNALIPRSPYNHRASLAH